MNEIVHTFLSTLDECPESTGLVQLSSLVGLICMLNQSDIALPVIEVPSGQFKVEHAINLRWSLPFISGSAIYALMKPTIVNPSTCLAKQQV